MASSSKLLKRFGVPALALAKASNRPARVSFQLPKSLRAKLTKQGYFHIVEDGEVDVDTLTRYFNLLCDMTNDENNKLKSNERLLIEKFKLVLMNAIRRHLEQLHAQATHTTIQAPHRKVTSKKVFRWIKMGLFVVYNVIMLPIGVCSGFVGFQSMLPLLIPGLAEGIVFGIAVALTAIDFVIQGLGQAKSLKEVLHVSLNNDAKRLLKTYQQQIKATKRINTLLPQSHIAKQMTQSEFKSLADVTVEINTRDLAYKQEQFNDKSFGKQFKENKFKKIAGWGVVGLQSIMIIGAGYFMAAALIGALAAPLLGTPAGWVIISLVIIGMLAGYICLRDDSVRSLLSPALHKFKVVKDKIKKFIIVDDFDHIFRNKSAFKSDKVKDDTEIVNDKEKTVVNESEFSDDESLSISSSSISLKKAH